MTKRKTIVPTNKQRKVAAIAMITSASDGHSPEESLYKSLLDRAVEDIGNEDPEIDSTQAWEAGELDCFMVAIGIEPSYAKRVLTKTGLI